MLSAGKLDELCAFFGIEREYWDIFGNHCPATPSGKITMLGLLGVSAKNDDEANSIIQTTRERRALSPLPPVWVQYGPVHSVHVHVQVCEADSVELLHWEMIEENGEVKSGRAERRALHEFDHCTINGKRYFKLSLPVQPPDNFGYHRLQVRLFGARPKTGETKLFYAPQKCFLPESLRKGQKVWGLSLQLYGLRSKKNWGIGDFAGLVQLAPQLKVLGADFIGLNPLHALFSSLGSVFSPYSPNSRMVSNYLYLPIEELADFQNCAEARAYRQSAAVQNEISALEALDEIDYERVRRLKFSALEIMYRHFAVHELKKKSVRAKKFLAFVESQGEALHFYALHEALHEHLSEEDPECTGWPKWPKKFQNPRGRATLEFARKHQERLQLFEYIQWLTQCELDATAEACKSAGMKIGLYTDLALGANGWGAEAWSQQDLYTFSASMGAPPDELGPLGQDWGLPPLLPEKLLYAELAPFISALRANMKSAGALRIDHVMSLFRLYWIPAKLSAKDGAYVRYPFDALLAAVAIESNRNSCLVIGEDLGTVPDEVREGMRERDVLSYKVFYFMKDGQDFIRPDKYPPLSLVVSSTHDLATVAGFWQGYDLETRKELGLFASQATSEALSQQRAEDRRRMLMQMEDAQLLPAGSDIESLLAAPLSAELCLAIHKYLARSGSLIQAVQIEDAVLQVEQANVPGTVHEHPNWRRRMKQSVDTVINDEFFAELAAEVTSARASRS